MTPEEATAIVSNERNITSWAPDYPTPGDVMVATLALAGGVSFATDAMPWGLFTIIEKSGGLAIGGIGFKNTPTERGEVEIGYGISRSYQGRGVATEAVTALCDFALLGVRVVLADTDRENVASQRVLEKCGFALAGSTEATLLWRKEGGAGNPVPPERTSPT